MIKSKKVAVMLVGCTIACFIAWELWLIPVVMRPSANGKYGELYGMATFFRLPVNVICGLNMFLGCCALLSFKWANLCSNCYAIIFWLLLILLLGQLGLLLSVLYIISL